MPLAESGLIGVRVTLDAAKCRVTGAIRPHMQKLSIVGKDYETREMASRSLEKDLPIPAGDERRDVRQDTRES
jgi:hypothetical protein